MSAILDRHMIWKELLININWQISNKCEIRPLQIRKANNISIILDLACSLEGYLNDVLIQFIERGFLDRNFPKTRTNLEKNLIVQFKNNLRKSTWKDYNSHYQTITQRKLSELDLINWKEILKLFELRNLISHSETIEILTHLPDESRDSKIEIKNRESLILWLRDEIKVIPKINLENRFEFNFFNDDLIKKLFEIVESFINVLRKDILKHYDIDIFKKVGKYQLEKSGL